jgi:hypothetical protein
MALPAEGGLADAGLADSKGRSEFHAAPFAFLVGVAIVTAGVFASASLAALRRLPSCRPPCS